MAPIGKALKVWIEDKGKETAKLMFKVQMDLQDSFAKEIFRKIKEGFINTVSVGFLPTEYEQLDPDNFWGGFKYLKQELLELSFVPVPANPQALIGMKELAIKDKRFTPVEDIRTLFPEIKDKKELEDIFKTKDDTTPPAEQPVEQPTNLEDEKPKEDEPKVEETPENKPNEESPKEETVNPDPPVEETPNEETPVEEKPEENEKTITVTHIKGLLDKVNKAGRVLSAKNERKIRDAVESLEEVLSELETEEEDDGTTTGGTENDYAKSIPYKSLGTEIETESWDGIGEIAKAQLPDVKEICAYVDPGKEEDKSAYKLAHHKTEGHKAVWRGVSACMASLMGAKGGAGIPKEYWKSVYEHLSEHYKEFGKTVPSYDLVENQVLAGLDEELTSLALEREEKHMVRLIKKVLENQKQEKKIEKKKIESTVTFEQQKKAFEIIEMALTIYQGKSMEGGAK
jgi:hypothetical protein